MHEQVRSLCSGADSDCDSGPTVFFLDTFSAGSDGRLSSAYEWFDETTITHPEDSYELSSGYLKIFAGRGQDLWGGYPRKRGAPMLLYPSPVQNYTLETTTDLENHTRRLTYTYIRGQHTVTLEAGQTLRVPDGLEDTDSRRYCLRYRYNFSL